MGLFRADGKCQEALNAAGAYALGCLDPDERAAFEAHVVECDSCAAELRSLRQVVSDMAQSAPGHMPRPSLRREVLESLEPSLESPEPILEALDRPSMPGGPKRPWLALAATLVVALGLGSYAARLQMRVAGLESRLQQALSQVSAADRASAAARQVSTELQASMGVLAAPDLVRIDLQGQPAAPQARGRALWSRARGMVFAASALPPLPEGQVYQVWVVAGPAPVSAGLLTPDASGGGVAFFETPADIPPPTAVAVTIEPAGGLPAPSGPFYLAGSPGDVL